jgi:hypothetical protein
MKHIKPFLNNLRHNTPPPSPEAIDIFNKYKILLAFGTISVFHQPRTLLCGVIFAAVVLAIHENVSGTQGSQLESLAGPFIRSVKVITDRPFTMVDAALLGLLFMVDNVAMIPAFWIGINLCMCAWNEFQGTKTNQ